MSDMNMDPSFYKPILSISIPPAQREAFYRALMTLRQRDGRPFVSLSALVVKAVITAAAVEEKPPDKPRGRRKTEATPENNGNGSQEA
jgi:hypothetical protein